MQISGVSRRVKEMRKCNDEVRTHGRGQRTTPLSWNTLLGVDRSAISQIVPPQSARRV